MDTSFYKHLFLTLCLLSIQVKAEQIDLLTSGFAAGQPCWKTPEKKYGLVCRNGVFQLASATSRWEEYRGIPVLRAKEFTVAAEKDGAACHYLDKELILVCYWR